jgi:hypothetical protein
VPAAPEADFERDVDRLYDLPLAEFVPARDELAKRARAERQGELAARVKRLRKPSVAAWVVNRLARERELDVQRLLKAGEALAKAQVEAAQGSAEGFPEARREEQRALERLGDAAREIVEREGLGAAVVERVTRTLRAGSLTDEGRELVKQGRLAEELQPPGFEALAGLAGAPARRARGRRAPQRRRGADDRAERRRATSEARQRVRALRAEERELEKAAAAAERDAERAEREAAAVRETADRARAEAESAAEARAAAEQELDRLEGH